MLSDIEGAVAIVARYGLSLVLILAVATKITRPKSMRDSLAALRVPKGVAPILQIAVIVLEAVLATLLLTSTHLMVAAVAVVLFLGFFVLHFMQRVAECGCFGAVGTRNHGRVLRGRILRVLWFAASFFVFLPPSPEWILAPGPGLAVVAIPLLVYLLLEGRIFKRSSQVPEESRSNPRPLHGESVSQTEDDAEIISRRQFARLTISGIGGVAFAFSRLAPAWACLPGGVDIPPLEEVTPSPPYPNPWDPPHNHCGAGTFERLDQASCVNGQWVKFYGIYCSTCRFQCGRREELGGPC